MEKVLLTGIAGFIGYHLAKLLLKSGYHVIGLDGMTPYYDIKLKKMRLKELSNLGKNLEFHEIMLEDENRIKQLFRATNPDLVMHLAAQAGVRYSIENPKSYLQSNIVGTYNILESSIGKVNHLLLASTSSVYGANTNIPFQESFETDTPMSFYAATKKASETLAHSISHIHSLPITCFRFFTVYGPWGRPDMALFKFVNNIIKSEPIDVYNFGKMKRDFTYVDDLVYAVSKLICCIPEKGVKCCSKDNISPIAPIRSVNIGNSHIVELLDFIDEIEKCLGIKAKKNLLPIQKGDVEKTFADTSVLRSLIGNVPSTDYKIGIKKFIDWYLDFYKEEITNG